MLNSPQSPAPLYDQDYYRWLTTTQKLLAERQFQQLDLVNLIEEIEDMGKREKNSVESNLRVVFIHLLKYQFQPEARSNSWLGSIREHRTRLRKALAQSPSLKPFLLSVFDECYLDARAIAADETGLPLEQFPSAPPFTSEQALDEKYLPN
ncbi:MAG: DUF29 family protein [Cyanobacteria bacterium RI_101]|nr:DUF29 family protein [Cyanobacteria bacterium RI_101]